MRNRCIEICFTGTATGEDLLDISRTNGVMNLSSAMTLRNVHEKLNSSKKSRLTQANPRDFSLFSKVVSSQISHGSDIKEALQRGILQVYSSYKINWDDLQDSLKLQRPESSYPSIYPAYLQIIEGFDTIPYTYQRDAAYFTYLVQTQNENKLAINSMFLNCSNEGSDCLTVNISEDFIREALKHFMSFGSIVDWEERLSWLSSYVKNTNNIVIPYLLLNFAMLMIYLCLSKSLFIPTA